MPYFEPTLWDPEREQENPARYEKPNPRLKWNLRTGSVSVLVNGVSYGSYATRYCCIGEKQVIFQGARHMLGDRALWTDSYCEVQIKHSAAEVFDGKIQGSIFSWKSYTWDIVTISGDLAASSPFMGTIRPEFFSVQDEDTPDSVYQEQSVLRAYAALNQPSTDVGLIALEINETLKMLKNPLSSVTSALGWSYGKAKQLARDKRPGNTRDFFMYLIDALTETWLEYRYGWLPLLNDVDSLMYKAANGLCLMDESIHKVRGKAIGERIEKLSFSDPTSQDFGGYSTMLYWGGMKRIRQKSITTLFYRDRTYMDTARELRDLGLSPVQWPSLAWELIPFSFIVDWGIGVNDWLAAWSPHPDTSLLGGHTSTTLQQTYVMELTNVFSSPYAKWKIITPPSFKMQVDTLLREPVSPPSTHPIVSPHVLNLKRTIDSVSLLWTNVPRFFKYRSKNRYIQQFLYPV